MFALNFCGEELIFAMVVYLVHDSMIINIHGDALCFMVKTWARHKTTETILNNGGRLAVGGPWGLSLIKKNWGFFRIALRKQGVARPPQQGTP